MMSSKQPEPDDRDPTSEDGRIRRARVLREKRRAEIVLAAQRVFADKGYHAGSITDIIEAAGVARGTFYLYFEGKRAIFEEILDTLLEQLRAVIKPVDVDAPESPSSQLFGSIRRVIEIFSNNEHLTRILLQQAVGLDREFDQKLDDFYGTVREMICSSLEQGMQMGIVRPVNPQVTSYFILGSVKEAMTAALLTHRPDLADLDAIAQAIVQYNLQGVFR